MSGSILDNYSSSVNVYHNQPLNQFLSKQSTNPATKKRKLDGSETEVVSNQERGKMFLPIRAGDDVFCTEDWKPSGTSLFCPVRQDLYVNIAKFDQISAQQGSFFTADVDGNFSKSVTGHVIHFWRYDKMERKKYISQSFLFTNSQEFLGVQAFLQKV